MSPALRSRVGGTSNTSVIASAAAFAMFLLAGCGDDPMPAPGGGAGAAGRPSTTTPPPAAGSGGGGAAGAAGAAGSAGSAGAGGRGGSAGSAGARAPDTRRPDTAANRDGRMPDRARADAPVVDAAPAAGPGNLAMGARCNAPDSPGGCQAGLLCCQPCCEGRPAVCSQPVQNNAGLGVGQCPLPDLAVNLTALQAEVGTGPMTFAANSCEARETCVAQPGTRNTLHFEVLTPNIGTADLILGTPAGKPGFEFAACHEHYHFNNYALYQLLDAEGNEVLKGLKRAFCLMDTDRNPDYPLQSPANARYNCGRQGIQRGWADSYYNGLECQYIDVTDVPPGRYKLRVSINPNRFFPELRYDNNVGEIEVDIAPMAATPTDSCAGLVRGLNRECGWTKAMTATCTPGAQVTVGCGAECGLGTRTGDPMMRICAGDAVCKSPGLARNDDCGQGNNVRGARAIFRCPAGGRYTVLTAASASGQAATCNVAIR